jgi:hypothetical protein
MLEAFAETAVIGTARAGTVELQLAAGTAERAPVRVELPLRTHVSGDGTRLRFAVPRATHPGSYTALVRLGRIDYQAEVEVEVLHNLVVVPGSLRFVVDPGDSTKVRLTINNQGNVPWLAPQAQAFGLFEVGGVESALATVYRAPDLRGGDRLDRFSDELASRHALVRAHATRPFDLAPGALVEAEFTLRWPEGLQRGRVYSGTWPFANVRLSVRAEVRGPAKSPEDPAQKREVMAR